jgi:Amylo-alpha-1,6-glucosidase
VTTVVPDPIRSGGGTPVSNGLAALDLARASRGSATILEEPLVNLGPEIAADLPSALRREWLVTNGLGGYASGTLAGVSVVESVGRSLLTPVGLRSLSPDHPDYRGDYIGGPGRRDTGYHQGPVWSWLLGPYAEAHYRVHRDRSAALGLLGPIEHHLRDACLGSVSEILEGDPPHRPVGCAAQAWGVAETLRVWRALAGTGSRLS